MISNNYEHGNVIDTNWNRTIKGHVDLLGGYLNVERPKFNTELAQAFIEAGKYLGYQETDINGARCTG